MAEAAFQRGRSPIAYARCVFAIVYPGQDLLNRLDEKAARRNEAGAISFDAAARGHACRVRTCAVSNTCTIHRVRVLGTLHPVASSCWFLLPE